MRLIVATKEKSILLQNWSSYSGSLEESGLKKDEAAVGPDGLVEARCNGVVETCK